MIDMRRDFFEPGGFGAALGAEREVVSAEGCLALLVWERQPIMLE
jgi:hypothetical protein